LSFLKQPSTAKDKTRRYLGKRKAKQDRKEVFAGRPPFGMDLPGTKDMTAHPRSRIRKRVPTMSEMGGRETKENLVAYPFQKASKKKEQVFRRSGRRRSANLGHQKKRRKTQMHFIMPGRDYQA